MKILRLKTDPHLPFTSMKIDPHPVCLSILRVPATLPSPSPPQNRKIDITDYPLKMLHPELPVPILVSTLVFDSAPLPRPSFPRLDLLNYSFSTPREYRFNEFIRIVSQKEDRCKRFENDRRRKVKNLGGYKNFTIPGEFCSID